MLIWDLTTGKIIARLEGHAGTIWNLMPSPSGKYLVSGGYPPKDMAKKPTGPQELEFRVWNMETLKEQRPPIFMLWQDVLAMAVSAQEELVVLRVQRSGVEFLPRIKITEK